MLFNGLIDRQGGSWLPRIAGLAKSAILYREIDLYPGDGQL
jgi:hypothetical protein